MLRMKTSVALLLIACALPIAAQTTVIHARSASVLAPTLVLDKNGDLVNSLTAEDFIITDNGAPQKLHLDEQPIADPVSLVVVLQTGRSASIQMSARDCTLKAGKGAYSQLEQSCTSPLTGLQTMLENILSAPNSRVALIAFDSHVRLVRPLLPSSQNISPLLADLRAGDDGAATLDAVAMATRLLAERPRGERKVILLISEMRDQGSRQTNIAEAVRLITDSEATIYSLAFSPLRAETASQLRGSGPINGAAPSSGIGFSSGGVPPGGVNLLGPLVGLAMASMKKNVAEAMASATGGEFMRFKNRQSFDEALNELANHLRGRYLLSFTPTDPTPGLHALRVRLASPVRGYKLYARQSYWRQAESPRNDKEGDAEAPPPAN